MRVAVQQKMKEAQAWATKEAQARETKEEQTWALEEARSWAEKEAQEQDTEMRTAYAAKKTAALRKARSVSNWTTGGSRRRGHAPSKRDGAACAVCSWQPWFGRLLHWHHILPVSRGGGNDSNNLVLLCPNHHAIAHFVSRRSEFGARYWGPLDVSDLREAIGEWEKGETPYGLWLAQRASQRFR